MASQYPAQIDSPITLPSAQDGVTSIKALSVNQLRDAIVNIQTTLGANPQTFNPNNVGPGTVAGRLNTIELVVFGPGGGIGELFSAGGDLAGTGLSQTVIGIRNVPVVSTTPSDGYLLTYNAGLASWGPKAPPVSFTAGRDLAGTYNSQTVVGLDGYALGLTPPTQSCVPVWDTALLQYSIRQLTADDLGVAFSISSFTGGSTVEIGATVTNPAFTASYSTPASSANITNTDSIDSPLTLSSPYTSGTVIGSFHHTSQATVTFTLTATGTSTKTSNQNINFYPRIFGGVGTAGATSSVTASGNTAVLSNGAVLANEGLTSNVVGSSFSFSPSGQSIYFLLVGGSHGFTDNSNQNTFVFNSPTAVSFTNQNGSVVSMYLYQSTATLTGTYSIKVSS